MPFRNRDHITKRNNVAPPRPLTHDLIKILLIAPKADAATL